MTEPIYSDTKSYENGEWKIVRPLVAKYAEQLVEGNKVIYSENEPTDSAVGDLWLKPIESLEGNLSPFLLTEGGTITGSLEIEGNTTLYERLFMSDTKMIAYHLDVGITERRATENHGGITFDDKFNTYVGGMLSRWYANGYHRINMEIKGETGDTKQLNLWALPDGTGYSECPYRPYSSAGNNDIITKGHFQSDIVHNGQVLVSMPKGNYNLVVKSSDVDCTSVISQYNTGFVSFFDKNNVQMASIKCDVIVGHVRLQVLVRNNDGTLKAVTLAEGNP